MFKKFVALLLVTVLLCAFVGCGATKIVHCDRCGTELEIEADSNMTEDWIILCEKCESEVAKENPDITVTVAE